MILARQPPSFCDFWVEGKKSLISGRAKSQ
jgi:hypothetical protein